MLGKRLENIDQIYEAAQNHRAVIDSMAWGKKPKPIPAAVVMNFSVSYVRNRINRGLYIYEKETSNVK